MISCDSTCCTVSMATPTTISNEVPPKKNGTFNPCVMKRGSAASSRSPMNGIGATRKPLIRKFGMIAMIARYTAPASVILVRIVSMYSAVRLPGRMPGTKPPYFRMFSATSSGLKMIAV
jgi:hypothetical protein